MCLKYVWKKVNYRYELHLSVILSQWIRTMKTKSTILHSWNGDRVSFSREHLSFQLETCNKFSISETVKQLFKEIGKTKEKHLYGEVKKCNAWKAPVSMYRVLEHVWVKRIWNICYVGQADNDRERN